MQYRNAFSWSHAAVIVSTVIAAAVPLSAVLLSGNVNAAGRIESRMESFAVQALEELRLDGDRTKRDDQGRFPIAAGSYADTPVQQAQGRWETKSIPGARNVIWARAVVEYRTHDGVEHTRIVSTILPGNGKR